MKKTLLLILAISFAGAGLATAEVKVTGYLAPNLMVYDHGDSLKANIGAGMYFNRFMFSGEVDGGRMLSTVKFKVESDISPAAGGAWTLKWAYIEPWIGDKIFFRLGHEKRQFSREILHPTSNLLTAMRHPTTDFLQELGYGGYTYGIEAHVLPVEMVNVAVGAYAGGEPDSPKSVASQDPAVDFGGRVIVTPIPGLEIAGNVYMITLPNNGSLNEGIYPDTDEETYQSNNGLAYGADFDFQRDLNGMFLWAQGEIGAGDNWMEVKEAGGDWDDAEFESFLYYVAKVRFMLTPEFGVHLGYSFINPNTNEDVTNDEHTMITPGLTMFWGAKMRTEIEAQLENIGGGLNAEGKELDDQEMTHFLIQQVLIWD